MVADLASQAREHELEIERGDRFEFGKNWQAFLSIVDDHRVTASVSSLAALLGTSDLSGRRFLDIGSGSGLSSLAAARLGASVVSFDYDPQSVACTLELRRRFARPTDNWAVEQGSALDEAYLLQLGTFDVVHSWGVLHHTGDMWRGLGLAAGLVAPGGTLVIAIYNDQGPRSLRWAKVKRLYCSGVIGRTLVAGTFIPYWVATDLLRDLVWLRNPLRRYSDYHNARGMSVTHDWYDWLGGYPFEVAKPEAIFEFYRDLGFTLTRLSTAGGSLGCNEFVFTRLP